MLEPLAARKENGRSAEEMAGLPAVPGASGLYLTRLRQLARLEVDERQAELVWREASFHRRALHNRLGRDVGVRVALLDYLVNFQPELLEPGRLGEVPGAEHRAITDELTGLYNRYFFDLEMVRETERCRRYRMPASLLLFDLDAFSGVAPRFGREAADEVLQGVAALVLHHVRAPDVACRYGGDQFAVILPGTPQVEALTVAQRICADVSDWFVKNPVGTNFVPVSMSCGVASVAHDSNVACGELLQEAAAALADAKKMGGHRVIAPLASPE